MALFVTVPHPLGASGGGDLERRVQELESIVTELIEQLNYCISNLGAENVLEAGSVDAKNINTDKNKITSDQIENLLATKLVKPNGEPIITIDSDGDAYFNGELA